MKSYQELSKVMKSSERELLMVWFLSYDFRKRQGSEKIFVEVHSCLKRQFLRRTESEKVKSDKISHAKESLKRQFLRRM